MYPTPATPNAGAFVEAQVESLRRIGVAVDVLHLPRHDLGRGVYRNLGKKVSDCVGRHDPDLVHVAYGGVMAGVVTRAVRDRPVVVTYHGTDLLAGPARGMLDSVALRLGVFASRRAALRAAGVIVVSRKLAGTLPRSVDRSRVWIVPNGVDLRRFRPLARRDCQRRLGWDPGRPHVLFPASSSRPEKRFALAQACVEALRRSWGQVELHVLDGVPHEEVPVWLNASSVVLMTSAHEGSPVVVKEALACNVPVVSVDVGDVGERVEEVEGCYIAEATVDDLAEKLRFALEREAPIDARESVADLSLERVAAEIRRIYVSLLNAAGEPSREL